MPFKKYEVLEHPAELRIKVYGKTLEELFSNAVLAMAQILKGDTNMNKVHIENNFSIQQMHTNDTNRKEVQVESIDINSLLVDFLNDILAKSQISRCVYNVAAIKLFPEPVGGSPHLEAELTGYPVERFDGDIKAVTYEDLDIKQVDRIWQTMIVFDI